MANDAWWTNSTTTAWNSTAEAEFDVAEYLQLQLGRRYRDLGESVSLIIVYCVIFLTGVVGNLCTCLVIARNKRMHTATNYYLFSLAVSDLLTLLLGLQSYSFLPIVFETVGVVTLSYVAAVEFLSELGYTFEPANLFGLPPELYTIIEAYPWRFGTAYCLFKTFLTEMTSSASILTIAAFTIERYLAICHSLRAQATSGLSRAVRCVIIVWIVACLTAVVYPIHTRTFYYVTDPRSMATVTPSGTRSTGDNGEVTLSPQPLADSLICTIPTEWMPNMRYAFQVSTFLLFVLPMILITVLYVRIGIALRQSAMASGLHMAPPTARWTSKNSVTTTGGEKNTHSRQTRHVVSRSTCSKVAQSRRSIFKMLIAVVMAFFVCWAPFHAQRLMTIYIRDDQWTPTWLETQSHLFYISGVLYFVSATVNPILYNVMSRKYRQSFKTTLCYRCQDDESRQRLRRSGFGASAAYFSSHLPAAVPPSGPNVGGARTHVSPAVTSKLYSPVYRVPTSDGSPLGIAAQAVNNGRSSVRSTTFTPLSPWTRPDTVDRSPSNGAAVTTTIGTAKELVGQDDDPLSVIREATDISQQGGTTSTTRCPTDHRAVDDAELDDSSDDDCFRPAGDVSCRSNSNITPKSTTRGQASITYVELVNVDSACDPDVVHDDRATEYRKSTPSDQLSTDTAESSDKSAVTAGKRTWFPSTTPCSRGRPIVSIDNIDHMFGRNVSAGNLERLSTIDSDDDDDLRP